MEVAVKLRWLPPRCGVPAEDCLRPTPEPFSEDAESRLPNKRLGQCRDDRGLGHSSWPRLRGRLIAACEAESLRRAGDTRR